MIAKGNPHAHGGRLAVYMITGKGAERAELIEARGFLSADLREAFCTIQAIAESQTQCEKPFFHVYVRLPDDESLDPADWLAVADRIESVLGFDDQPRAVAFHVAPDGERHLHAAWSRIDTDAMRAIDPGLYKNKLTELSRELEIEYGLRQLQSKRSPEQLTKVPARGEFEEARRLGVDVETTRETIRVCYDQSDNGPSFVAALAEHGLALARGDRRDFVVIDQEGGQHALGKRICGVALNDVRQRFGTTFKQGLPSVDEVRQTIERDTEVPATPQVPKLRQSSQESEKGLPAELEIPAAEPPGESFDIGRGLERGASVVLDAGAKLVEGVFGFLDGLIGGGSTKPTRTKGAETPPPAMTAKERHAARVRAFRESDNGQAARQEAAHRIGASEALTDDELRRELEAQEKRRQEQGGGITR